jgi:hypothetical protein
MISNRGLSKPWIRQFIKAGSHQPVSLVNLLRQILAASTFRLRKPIAQEKVLLLASTQDKMVSSRCSRDLARTHKFQLIMHPTAGHDLPVDDPDWVIKKIQAALT